MGPRAVSRTASAVVHGTLETIQSGVDLADTTDADASVYVRSVGADASVYVRSVGADASVDVRSASANASADIIAERNSIQRRTRRSSPLRSRCG